MPGSPSFAPTATTGEHGVPVRARLPLRQHENRNALRERPDAVSRRYRCGSSRLGTRRSMNAGRHLRSRYGRLRIAYGADRAVLPPAAPHGPDLDRAAAFYDAVLNVLRRACEKLGKHV